MNQEEIIDLQKQLEHSIEIFEKSLKDSHINIEDSFYNNRDSVIKNLKTYLVNISIVSATIIPFSSLVFQIPEKVMAVNLNLWILSLLAFIVCLSLFIFCFLKLIKIDRKTYIKLLLAYIGSGQIDFTSFSAKDNNTKLAELMSIMDSQNEFNKHLKTPFNEKDFVSLTKFITFGSWLFITGLALFFLSIVYSKIITLLY